MRSLQTHDARRAGGRRRRPRRGLPGRRRAHATSPAARRACAGPAAAAPPTASTSSCTPWPARRRCAPAPTSRCCTAPRRRTPGSVLLGDGDARPAAARAAARHPARRPRRAAHAGPADHRRGRRDRRSAAGAPRRRARGERRACGRCWTAPTPTCWRRPCRAAGPGRRRGGRRAARPGAGRAGRGGARRSRQPGRARRRLADGAERLPRPPPTRPAPRWPRAPPPRRSPPACPLAGRARAPGPHARRWPPGWSATACSERRGAEAVAPGTTTTSETAAARRRRCCSTALSADPRLDDALVGDRAATSRPARALVGVLEGERRLVRLTDGLAVPQAAYDEARRIVHRRLPGERALHAGRAARRDGHLAALRAGAAGAHGRGRHDPPHRRLPGAAPAGGRRGVGASGPCPACAARTRRRWPG